MYSCLLEPFPTVTKEHNTGPAAVGFWAPRGSGVLQMLVDMN